MPLPNKTRFDPSFDIVDKAGKPTQFFKDYMRSLDALVAAMASGVAPNNLVNAANDAAAAQAGVAVQGLYRNGSVIQVRVI